MRGEINLWSQITITTIIAAIKASLSPMDLMTFILTMKCTRLSPTGLIRKILINHSQEEKDTQKPSLRRHACYTYYNPCQSALQAVMCIIAGSDHFETGGLNYQYIHNNKEYIRLLTYMFLHANLPHFINNMVALVSVRFKT